MPPAPAETRSIAPATRRPLGAFYTPRPIVDYMVVEALAAWLEPVWSADRLHPLLAAEQRPPALSGPERARLSRAIGGLKILDPACGDGVFLAGMWDKLALLGERLSCPVEASSLYGVDIDPSAVACARLRLPAQIKLVAADGLLFDPQAVFGVGDGFDIIIGNPPYIKERNNRALFAAMRETPLGRRYHRGKMDYWYYFLHRALELARPGGIVAFITPKYWLHSRGAAKLIRHIRRAAALIQIVDLGRAAIFEGVSGHHMIHLYRVGVTDAPCRIKQSGQPEVIRSGQALFTPDDQIDLWPDSVKISTAYTLGDLFAVSQGVVQNPARVSHRAARRYGLPAGAGVFVLTAAELDRLQLNKAERGFVRPFYRPAAIRPFSLAGEERQYLLYLTASNCPSLAGLPQIEAHLARFRPIMAARRETRQDRVAWFQLHWPRQPRFFEGPKVAIPSMFRRPRAAYAPDPAYFGLSSNVIIAGADTPLSLKWLTGLLNSKLAAYWLGRYGKKRGAGVDVGVGKLRRFPLPAPDQSRQAELIPLVERMLAAPDPALSARIDQLLYQVYNLSPEDIHRLEQQKGDHQ